MAAHAYPGRSEFKRLFFALLAPEAQFYRVVLVYSLAISLLTLAVPISVQTLIDTVANTAVPSAVLTIAVLLFVLLLLSGVLYALRAYAMELFNRRLFSRISSEMVMSGLLGDRQANSGLPQLSNRFFDIMTLKKNIPYLLASGFTLLLQTAMGFILVSFYHTYFFVLSACIIFLLYLTWKVWGWQAIRTAFELSDAKYETAAWLQEVHRSELPSNVEQRQNLLEQSNDLIHFHMDRQSAHFRFNYRQLLALLMLYATASAVLLGLGGWLVVRGELSLGQLVAAELVMSAIFGAFPQMASYLDQFYDLCAAVEEISRYNEIEVDTSQTGVPAPEVSS